MNYIISRLSKLSIFTSDLDYHLVRASMMIMFLFSSYQKNGGPAQTGSDRSVVVGLVSDQHLEHGFGGDVEVRGRFKA